MSEDDVQQDEAAPETTAEGSADVIEGGDESVADQVDAITVDKLTDDTKSPQPAGVEGDPIGDAEAHIESLDMDAERKKAADLMKNL